MTDNFPLIALLGEINEDQISNYRSHHCHNKTNGPYRPKPKVKSMPENISNTLLAVAGTLLGVAFGILGTYFVSLHLARNHAKSLAGLRLRDAFAPEIAKIRLLTEETRHKAPDILRTAFEKHLMAANEFDFFLSKNERIAFAKAWEQYIARDSDRQDRFDKYLVLPEEAIEAIYVILEFTKH